MSNIQIFVEGVADQKFFHDLILEWYGVELTIGSAGKTGEILELGGKTAFDSEKTMQKLAPLLTQLTLQEIPLIVIFDADLLPDNHSLLTKHSQTHGFKFFLLPDNSSDGDLEMLLQQIICPDNQVVFDCWSIYEQCLSGKSTTSTESGKFYLPASKTKIYNYMEVLVGKEKDDNGKEKAKEPYRDYRNKKHWNLNPAHPPLQPLKVFLDQFFSTPQ